ncbi:MAG: hypothetical protein ACE5I3_15855, partial [Phycisphaerae bacterium]
PAPYNPRVMDDEQHRWLRLAMEKYGDLSGICYNRRTGRLFGGHQRVKHFESDATVRLVEELEEPNEVYTVARGYIVLGGELWSYREVDAPEEWEMGANLCANQFSGRWVYPDLPNLLSELDATGEDHRMMGFSEADAARILGLADGSGDQATEVCPTCGRKGWRKEGSAV